MGHITGNLTVTLSRILLFHNKKIGFSINVLQQTACLEVNPITVDSFAFLFNCSKNQESIQSSTYLSQDTKWKSNKILNKHHKGKSVEEGVGD